jgi:hypothetical protein
MLRDFFTAVDVDDAMFDKLTVDYLRNENFFHNLRPSQVAAEIKGHNWGAPDLNDPLCERLENFDTLNPNEDPYMVVSLVLTGLIVGRPNNVAPWQIKWLYWQAAALLMEQLGVHHLRELRVARVH